MSFLNHSANGTWTYLTAECRKDQGFGRPAIEDVQSILAPKESGS